MFSSDEFFTDNIQYAWKQTNCYPKNFVFIEFLSLV